MSRALVPLLVVVVAIVAGCSSPGEGWKFERARSVGDPAVAAINAFRREHGRVPRDMHELVPKYLSQEGLAALGADDSIGFEYVVLDKDEFEFRMNYRGPGTNECVYVADSSPPSWSCFGAY